MTDGTSTPPGAPDDDTRAEALRLFHTVREKLMKVRFEVEVLENLFWRLAATAGATYQELVQSDPAQEAHNDTSRPAA